MHWLYKWYNTSDFYAVHHLTIFIYVLSGYRHTGACPSWHWMRGRVLSGQLTSPSLGWHTTIQLHIHTQSKPRGTWGEHEHKFNRCELKTFLVWVHSAHPCTHCAACCPSIFMFSSTSGGSCTSCVLKHILLTICLQSGDLLSWISLIKRTRFAAHY